MNEIREITGIGCLVCAALVVTASLPAGADEPANVIASRQALMADLQLLMQPVDALTAGQAAAEAEIKSAGSSVAQMLTGVPNLFPPATNLYDAAAETPATLALPAIWDNLAAFAALNATAVEAATRLATLDGGALMTEALSLRSACDACHASFMRAYEPARASSEDLEFDFDALFEDD